MLSNVSVFSIWHIQSGIPNPRYQKWKKRTPTFLPRFVYIKFICTYLVHFDRKAKSKTSSNTQTNIHTHLNRL